MNIIAELQQAEGLNDRGGGGDFFMCKQFLNQFVIVGESIWTGRKDDHITGQFFRRDPPLLQKPAHDADDNDDHGSA